MGFLSTSSSSSSAGGNVPLGGYADVFASGDAYKAVGSMIRRSQYPKMSAAFPRQSAYSAASSTAVQSGYFTAIGYGNGLFVAMNGVNGAEQSTCLTTPDGVVWNVRQMPASLAWNGVAYGAGKWVAVATAPGNTANTICATSIDGVTWTANANMPAGQWRAVVWNPTLNLFVAICGGTVAYQMAATSPDGVVWTVRALPSSGTWAALAVGAQGVVVATSLDGRVARSVDGITWTVVNAPAGITSLASVTWGKGLFVSWNSQANQVMSSADGITWTVKSIVHNGASGGKVVFAEGLFVVACLNAPYAFTSNDGINWFVRSSALALAVGGIAYGAGVVVYGSSTSSALFGLIYAENDTDSDYMFISGTAGKFVRVK